jgi:hypothetical protein
LTILQIEHDITSFDTWKMAFDRDPLNRRESGVGWHRIARPVDNSNYVVLDLEFESRAQAEAFLNGLQEHVWRSRDTSPALGGAPKTRIIEVIESQHYECAPNHGCTEPYSFDRDPLVATQTHLDGPRETV